MKFQLKETHIEQFYVTEDAMNKQYISYCLRWHVSIGPLNFKPVVKGRISIVVVKETIARLFNVKTVKGFERVSRTIDWLVSELLKNNTR